MKENDNKMIQNRLKRAVETSSPDVLTNVLKHMENIGDMELKGIDLDVAVNALIGSMIRHGYLSEINNSILITVNSEDETKGEQLQQRLSAEVDSLLRSFSLDSAILASHHLTMITLKH